MPTTITAKKEEYDIELLRRIEDLITRFQKQVIDAEGTPREEALVYGLRVLVSFAKMVLEQRDIFGIEPWHIVSPYAPLPVPGEMLLRVKDFKGQAMPPYPAIMAFYESGYTADIDGILFLAALGQYDRMAREGLERQVSINISARSLRDPDFVKCTLARLESLDLESDQKIIVEIHESTPYLSMSRQVLELYRFLGVGFAIDDVGLNMHDVLRLSDFEGLAGFVKIDRSAVCAAPEARNSLKQVMSFVRTMMPEAVAIAEGVRDEKHALQISRDYPDVQYVQGMYLPERRADFNESFAELGQDRD